MDSNEHNKIIAFDTLFSNNHIQKLKIMLPYMDNQTQKSLAVYIKFLELMYTIDFYKKNPYPLCGCMEKEPSADFQKMCTELLPYCTPDEKKQIEQIRSIFQSMEMYKEMSKTMEMMKDFMPDAGSPNGFPFGGENAPFGSFSQSSDSQNPFSAGGGDMMNMLMGMLSPEQKQMFEMFGGNHNDE